MREQPTQGKRVSIDEQTAEYLERFIEPEDESLHAARARSEEADIRTIPHQAGALLRWFARLLNARHIVEVGSGGGYSGLWLLGGMDPRGTLTTIEVDRDHQGLAQRAYADGGVADRARSILGSAHAVLPRLADGIYDIAFIDGDWAEYPDYLDHATRLLRPGGLLLADNVLATGADTEGLRTFNDTVGNDDHFNQTILTVGNGLLAATYQPGEDAV